MVLCRDMFGVWVSSLLFLTEVIFVGLLYVDFGFVVCGSDLILYIFGLIVCSLRGG